MFYLAKKKHNNFICIIPATAANSFGLVQSGLYLDRLIIKVVSVRSGIQCFHSCIQSSNCASANFWKGSLFYDNICVLNAATRNEYYARIGKSEDVYYNKTVTEWVYFELLN